MNRKHCCAQLFFCVVLVTSHLISLSCLAEFRSFDGIGNNLANPLWGSAETNFARTAPVDYVDGTAAARLTGRPNPRSVGSAIFRQIGSRPDSRQLSGFVYAFGNLLSHDTQETISGTTEFVPFRIPAGDDIFIPNQTVQLPRSLSDPSTGTDPANPRQQINFATAFIDGSQIYGSNSLTASILRGGPANPGAKLKNSNDINGDLENLLPHNAFGPAPDAPYVAGDSRVNDNVVLTAMHTLFMREHNRLVDVISNSHPDWSAEELYQRARKIVGAELQSITFNEFLPALLGPNAPPAVGNYDPNLNPAIFNEFPTVFLRIGHSMLTNDFKRATNDGQPAPGGPLPLEQAFENPAALATATDLDLFLKGLSIEVQEETDSKMVDGMRFALLDAFDIQRARDHGLPDYNTLRAAYGLPRVTTYAEITSDMSVQNAIAAVYPDINTIDPLVGVLAEDHLPGASVGPLAAAGFRLQFERLRDGDRFWYERDPDFSVDELATLRHSRLADIIRRNTGVMNVQDNVFFAVPEPSVGILAFLAGSMAYSLRRRFG
jgi:peroxidase